MTRVTSHISASQENRNQKEIIPIKIATFDDAFDICISVTDAGILMQRVSMAVLDCKLNEAHDDSSDASSKQQVDRKALVVICNKGKRLRQIVKVSGIGVLFYRRISVDPAKATTLALLESRSNFWLGMGGRTQPHQSRYRLALILQYTVSSL
ncbi:hypothetical protein J7T55_002200 [Diaporthe amygdali]|uniref:uncharacterized protein n=1 Tax=Phomopsis amygdali TaxID=1214568 RepID=UPI0022FE8D78|nr:uncharacterized protein J7T55_002200 [Diaporthe amygdali]KAJ0103781.1 hypothetical protein J7T55_002200 [Diaporthe amygdali]